MGFCVLHYDKQTGSSPGLSQHIERGCYRDGEWVEWHPTNADTTRTHLNRELISGELSRDERINKRIKDAGIKKLKKNQVTALTLIMSASCEDMQRIMKEGKFYDWCRSSIKWAQDTHGEENVVSAVLHMDEKTPHLHVTVVPIVQGMSKDQIYHEKKAKEAEEKGIEQKKKRKYKKKDLNTQRLCAADVMARTRLKEYQTTYANAVEEYGLSRGIDGSIAKHVDINDWYKELIEKVAESEARLRETEAEREKAMSEYVSFSKESKTLQTANEKLTTKISEKQDMIISLQSNIDILDIELSDKTERKEKLRGAYDGIKDLFVGESRRKVKEAEQERDKAIASADEKLNEAQVRIELAEKKRMKAEAVLSRKETELRKAEEQLVIERKRISDRLHELIELDSLKRENSNLKEAHMKTDRFLADAESFNLSASKTRQLFNNRTVEVSSLTDPESGKTFSRSDGKPIRLRIDKGMIMAFLVSSWELAKEWFRTAVNSPWFSTNGIPNDRKQSKGLSH